MTSSLEKTIVALIYLILSSALLFVHILNWPSGYADSAFFAEIVENISHRGLPLTQINAGVGFSYRLAHQPASEICNTALGSLKEINEFGSHVYAILYPLWPILKLLPSSAAVSFLMIFSFTGLILSVFITCRQLKMPKLHSLIISAAVSLHPAWSSAIFGQSYVDRLFLLLGFVFMTLLYSKTAKIWQILLAGALCTLINDRTGTIVSVLTFGSTILFFPKFRTRLVPLLALGIITAVYSRIMVHYVIDDFAPGFFRPLSRTFDFFDYQIPLLKIFFGASLPLLMLAIFNWRATVLALGTMLPNVFGNIGGAEKTGWSTHYHSYYIPILAWASIQGFLVFRNYLNSRGIEKYSVIPIGGVLFASLYFTPSADYLTYNHRNTHRSAWFVAYHQVLDSIEGKRSENPLVAIDDAIPKNVSVMMGEAGMAYLYPDRRLYLVPSGLDIADYALLAISKQEGTQYEYENLLPFKVEGSPEVQSCLLSRMRKSGYDLDNPSIFGHWALIRRTFTPQLSSK